VPSTGQLSSALGKQDRARGWWAKSIESARQLGARPELARTHREVGQRLSHDTGLALNQMDAAAHLDTARRLFEELQLRWDLDQLEGERAGTDPRRALGT
jgi:hypothetical protein